MKVPFLSKTAHDYGISYEDVEEIYNSSPMNFFENLKEYIKNMSIDDIDLESKNNKNKEVECPDCLGWGSFDGKNPINAGEKCGRCKDGKILVPLDSKIPNWNIGGSGDMSHGT